MLCLLGKPKFSSPYSRRAPEGQCLQVQFGGVGKTDITSGAWRVFPLEVGQTKIPKFSMGDGNRSKLQGREKGWSRWRAARGRGAGRGFGAVPAAPRILLEGKKTTAAPKRWEIFSFYSGRLDGTWFKQKIKGVKSTIWESNGIILFGISQIFFFWRLNELRALISQPLLLCALIGLFFSPYLFSFFFVNLWKYSQLVPCHGSGCYFYFLT